MKLTRRKRKQLPSIRAATQDYERWLRSRLPAVDEKGFAEKREKMKHGPFEFLRGTFYRWMQRWPEIAEDLQDAPQVLAVGDLHIENFGTWRDVEGRLVWGINDFDEAYRLPYTLDLVRLATSARLAIAEARLKLSPAAACRAILGGYRQSLAHGGEPVILGDKRHDWLRQVAQGLWRSWEPLEKLAPARNVPRAAAVALKRALPSGSGYDVRRRRAGLGSLGKPRFVALGVSLGGAVAREVKAMTPSAAAWALATTVPSRESAVLRGAVRAPDPFYKSDGRWLVRRLAPDCGKLELGADHGVPRERQLLEYMGHETANVHLGTPGAATRILADLEARHDGWLDEASRRGRKITVRDWKSWRD